MKKRTFKNIILITLLFFLNNNIHAKTSIEVKDRIHEMLNIYKTAFNTSNFQLIKPHLTNDIGAGQMPKKYAFQYITGKFNSDGNRKIKEIEKVKIKLKENESIAIVKFNEVFENNENLKLKFTFKKITKQWYFSNLSADFITDGTGEFTGSFTTYSETDSITGKTNTTYASVNFLNLESLEQITQNRLIVFYEKGMEALADSVFQVATAVHATLTKELALDSTQRHHIALTSFEGDYMLKRYKGECVWAIPVKKGDCVKDLTNLFAVYPHEFVEGILTEEHGLLKTETRWFRDGMAEYMLYLIAKNYSVDALNQHIKNRRLEYDQFKGNGTILDWRHILEDKNYGTPPIQAYHFSNEKMPYGRSMQFFIDLEKDYGIELIQQIHAKLKGSKNISNSKLITLISELTGDDIFERIQKY